MKLGGCGAGERTKEVGGRWSRIWRWVQRRSRVRGVVVQVRRVAKHGSSCSVQEAACRSADPSPYPHPLTLVMAATRVNSPSSRPALSMATSTRPSKGFTIVMLPVGHEPCLRGGWVRVSASRYVWTRVLARVSVLAHLCVLVCVRSHICASVHVFMFVRR